MKLRHLCLAGLGAAALTAAVASPASALDVKESPHLTVTQKAWGIQIAFDTPYAYNCTRGEATRTSDGLTVPIYPWAAKSGTPGPSEPNIVLNMPLKPGEYDISIVCNTKGLYPEYLPAEFHWRHIVVEDLPQLPPGWDNNGGGSGSLGNLTGSLSGLNLFGSLTGASS